jgi:hypothetical protein
VLPFVPFAGFVFFLLLDDLLELFCLLVFQMCFMCFGFEIHILCFYVVIVLIKGEIEKPSGQYLGLIVIIN